MRYLAQGPSMMTLTAPKTFECLFFFPGALTPNGGEARFFTFYPQMGVS